MLKYSWVSMFRSLSGILFGILQEFRSHLLFSENSYRTKKVLSATYLLLPHIFCFTAYHLLYASTSPVRILLEKQLTKELFKNSSWNSFFSIHTLWISLSKLRRALLPLCHYVNYFFHNFHGLESASRNTDYGHTKAGYDP